MRGISRAGKSFQPELTGAGGYPAQILGIDPGSRNGAAHKGDQPPHAEIADVFRQRIGFDWGQPLRIKFTNDVND